MKAFVTGAMGFLGKHLVDRLVADNHSVIIYDRKHIPSSEWGHWTYLHGDVLDLDGINGLRTAMQMVKPDVVFHLAALADVRSALKMPHQQLEQNLIATFNVLEAMTAAEVKRIAFTSTAVVYGDTGDYPVWGATKVGGPITAQSISERSFSFPQQTSIYGAMKLASESLISAYCEGYGMRADIFRFVSLVGAGYRHGNLMDFYNRLKTQPERLQLFGAPTQEKYYIAVSDAIEAMILAVSSDHGGCELWNVSHDAPNSIQDSITAVIDALGIPTPQIDGGDAWPGDLPQLVLDCSKLRALGWSPKVDIQDAMRATVRDFVERGL